MKKLGFLFLLAALTHTSFGLTRNIVPSADGEGSFGVTNLFWHSMYVEELYTDLITSSTGTNTFLGKSVFGLGNTASGISSFAQGVETTASGDYSHAQGVETTASGAGSHAQGVETTASGIGSYAQGFNTRASGRTSHAQGHETKADGFASHAQGFNTTASGHTSHAQGHGTKAGGFASHAAGSYAYAAHDRSYVWAGDASLSTNNLVTSTANDQYTVHAANGTRLLGGDVEVGNGLQITKADGTPGARFAFETNTLVLWLWDTNTTAWVKQTGWDSAE